MAQDAFKKFVNPKKNSVIKEEFKQEKKKALKEKRAYFENLKKLEYEARQAKRGAPVKKPTAIIAAPGKKEKEIIPAKNTAKPNTVKPTAVAQNTVTTDEVMPLNKFLAHCGICSRRDAVKIISDSEVKVNGTVCLEPGYKVQPTDEIIYNNKKLYVTKNLVYILLNKPKNHITTTEDPEGRKTVLDLVKKATDLRVYPIGRLDRNTTGVLILTNDGDLAQKLSHPSYSITKVYEAKLDKALTKADFEKILNGLVLEDGPVQVDTLAYADDKDKSVIGIEIHSGRNRIVRRIFESLGYDVKSLDRVMYAGLTKKNVERSKWRYLSEKEIKVLKYMNESKRGKKKESFVKDQMVSEFIPTVAGKTDKIKGSDYSNKEIAEAIGEKILNPEKVKRVKEEKIPKARKFKTHSEKKAHALKIATKK
jgi:23S rRNA pseudouridine2605 synthase